MKKRSFLCTYAVSLDWPLDAGTGVAACEDHRTDRYISRKRYRHVATSTPVKPLVLKVPAHDWHSISPPLHIPRPIRELSIVRSGGKSIEELRLLAL